VLVIGVVDVGLDGILALYLLLATLLHTPLNVIGDSYRRDLLRQVDRLGDDKLARLDGALEVHIPQLLAQVGLHVDEFDVAIFDLDVHIGALENRVLHLAAGFDDEGCATVNSTKP
jgi:hypothetical protein